MSAVLNSLTLSLSKGELARGELFGRFWPANADLHPIRQLLDVGHRDALARLDAAQDLDAIAQALAGFQLANDQLVALDDEHAIHAVAVLQRRVRHAHHLVSFAALDMHAREGAWLQRRVM